MGIFTLTSAPIKKTYKTWHEKSISEFCESSDGSTLLDLCNAASGRSYGSLENFIVRDEVGTFYANGVGSAGASWLGYPALTAIGTATARTVAVTNNYTRLRKLGYVSSSAAGNLSGHRTSAGSITIGDGTVGGFTIIKRFGTSDAATVSGARQFVGISAAGAPTNVEPNTLTNVIGVGNGASDTNLKIFYGGSAAQTPVDLGASFPANTLSLDPYELALFSFTELNNKVGYQVKHLLTGAVTRGILTAATPGTQLPATTQLMAVDQCWRCNNATALAVGLDIIEEMLGAKNDGFI